MRERRSARTRFRENVNCETEVPRNSLLGG